MSFEEILQIIAWKYVWNPALPIIFLLFGLYVTIGTRFFQIRRFGTIWRNTVGKIVEARRGKGPGILTSFQAWATAAGGAIGMGNIAGVSSAVALGGPGAIFWMWVSALMGMVTKMCEVTLAVHYREVFPRWEGLRRPLPFISKRALGRKESGRRGSGS
ncbi:alanine:cation symporter family protein [Acetomicrobium sp.]|uniref:alanine:cation symporter family protein n=1 Tax=Acetomicrobium sp. TaxID=1872099 RepID=UPI002871BF09|nr:alanine:cation symporter family protein [Acetomicrobium sp.]MDR9768975.1 alanine:cation symporter family protein [Acetomicrobium sp.]